MRWLVRALALPLLLHGCSIGPTQMPAEDHFYRLPPPRPEARPSFSLDGAVGIERLRSDGLHSERALLYVDAARPLEIRRHRYHFWVDSPPRMIRNHLLAYFNRLHPPVPAVLYQGPSSSAYLLTGELRDFERIRIGAQTDVRVVVRLSLQRLADGQRMLDRPYGVTRRVDGSEIHASVVAFGAALDEALDRFIHDLDVALGEQAPPRGS